jgi:hypothetical protein
LEYLARNHALFVNNTILELGAGLGGLGIGLALSGAALVGVTDTHTILPLIEYNLGLNNLSNRPCKCAFGAGLVWGNIDDEKTVGTQFSRWHNECAHYAHRSTDSMGESVDLIVGGDIAYGDEIAMQSLSKTLRRFSRSGAHPRTGAKSGDSGGDEVGMRRVENDASRVGATQLIVALAKRGEGEYNSLFEKAVENAGFRLIEAIEEDTNTINQAEAMVITDGQQHQGSSIYRDSGAWDGDGTGDVYSTSHPKIQVLRFLRVQ